MKLEQMRIKELLDTSHTVTRELSEGHEYPWGALGDINGFTGGLGASLPKSEYKETGKDIWTHKIAWTVPTTAVGGSMIIGPRVQIHNGAFLRRGVTLGQYVVIDNPCEIKNSIILDEAQVSYFNYVGDSILGYKAYVGVDTVTSNVEADKGLMKIHAKDGDVETGHKKFGAVLGDHAEIGCNSMLNPGAIIERNSNIYPLSSVRDCVPSDSIHKGRDNIVVREAGEVETEQKVSETLEKGKDGLKVVK